MIRKRLLPLGIFLSGLALGSLIATIAHPRIVVAQSMGAMNRGMHMSVADRQLMDSMQTMNAQMRTMKLTGDTDRHFMMMMIPHHRAAVAMAQTEMQYGKNEHVRGLAQKIFADQRKEIAQMKDRLAESF